MQYVWCNTFTIVHIQILYFKCESKRRTSKRSQACLEDPLDGLDLELPSCDKPSASNVLVNFLIISDKKHVYKSWSVLLP